MNDTPKFQFCETCNAPLSACGPLDGDGCPSMDCRVCKLREKLAETEKLCEEAAVGCANRGVELRDAYQRISWLEQQREEFCQQDELAKKALNLLVRRVEDNGGVFYELKQIGGVDAETTLTLETILGPKEVTFTAIPPA